MKSYKEELWFNTKTRRDYINITDQVQDAIDKSTIQEGLCLVNAMHISASVYINDDENGLLHDYDQWLEKLAPHAPVSQYRHNDTGEDNADAHLKRQVMGREVVPFSQSNPGKSPCKRTIAKSTGNALFNRLNFLFSLKFISLVSLSIF